MVVCNYNYQNLFFEGLKENKILGKKVLKEFAKQFGKPHSNTFVNAKIMQHENNPRYQDIIPEVLKISEKYSAEGDRLRMEMEVIKPKTSLQLADYINKLKFLVKTNKVANCAECADIVQFDLLQKGEKPHNIFLKITDILTGERRENGTHAFTVFGLKKDAELNNPQTWGNEAVIVDAWAGIVEKADDALKYLKTFMCFNQFRQNIEYKSYDIVPLTSSLK